jgi:tetratricopeptide (TPR) repeat protein
MTMKHVDERTLGLYAIDPAKVRNRAEIEGHVAACAECGAELESIRAFDFALRQPESWAGLSRAAPAPEQLRAFAARAAAEDAAAEGLLAGFEHPESAARFVWADIPRKPDYQTGGVTRLLCQRANGMCERDPLYALKLAEAARVISYTLPDDRYPRSTLHELRGHAYKEEANAFLFLGRLPEAWQAITFAEREYRKLSFEGVGMVAVKYIRGLICYEQDDLEAAERYANEAAEDALQLGMADRYMSARHLLGYVHFDRREYAMAASIYESILRYGEEKGAAGWIARESLAVGGCYLELGRTSEATRYLYDALRLFTDLGYGPDITRTHWSIARLMFAEGNGIEAIFRLRKTITEFTEYEMLTDAAVVAVDLAEILHATGRLREIPKVLANVVQTFVDAGKLTSALTALAYLKEAATAGTLTTDVVAYVRRFVQRADRQPDLLFAPPREPL